jgi:hypothetical protein
MKFLSQINVNTEYTLPIVDGSNGQVLATDGNGAVYWGSVSAGSTNLDGLTDVIITSPQIDQILAYTIPLGESLPAWRNITSPYATKASPTFTGIPAAPTAPTSTNTTQIATTAFVKAQGYITSAEATNLYVPYDGAIADVDLGENTLLSRNIVVNHASGSGVAVSITKGGNGEALTVVKSSGSGNAASITGGVTLLTTLHLTNRLADDYINSAVNWNTAYNDRITAASVTGTGTKTLTLTQGDSSTITATWVDYDTDTDAQTLTWTKATSSVSISNGNSVTLEGLATEEYVTSQGYITGYTETDPIFTASAASSITTTNISNWNTAYGWGNHASAGYATQSYVNTAISNLVDAAPSTLDTLNELAAALGDDPNFATTVSTNIGTKVSKSGDTMTGSLQVNNKIGTTDNQGIFLRGIGDVTHKIYFRSSDGGNVWEYNSPIKFEFYNLGTPVTRLTLTEAGNLTITGTLSASGYNNTNWDTAYNDRITAAAVSGTTTKTLTLTQGDGGTVTATWTDYDTNDQELGWDLSTQILSISGGNEVDLRDLASQDFVTSQGYLTSYTETDTLSSVAARGATTSITLNLARVVTTGLYGPSTSGNIAIWQYDASNLGYGIVYNEGSPDTLRIDVSGQALSGTPDFLIGPDYAQVNGNTVWHSGNDGSGSGLDADLLDGIDSSRIVYGDGPRASTSSINVNDPNQKSGFYFQYQPEGAPFGGEWWNWMTVAGNSWQSSNNYSFQLAHQFHGEGFYVRRMTNGEAYSWRQIWTSGDFTSTNVSNWNTAYNDKINSASFNTTNGVLTLTQQDGGTVTVDLDGRYLSSDSDNQELTWDSGSKTLGITNGNSVVLDLASEDFVTSQGYITGYTETDTLASVTGRGATTSIPITVTGTEGREVAVYIPSSYTTDDLVAGHEYGWYSDHWRLGMTRTGGAAGGDFVVQWNGARRLSLTSGGNLTVTGTVTATGGNSTNWNTAYSWGNHADVPYLNTEVTDPVNIFSSSVRFSGDVRIDGNLEVVGTLTESSSIRFKENIKPLEPALGKVEQLNPVTYNKIGVAEEEIGLIAEEVAELFPEVVTYNEAGQPQGIQYQRLSVILLKAVQELSNEVKELKAKLK